MPAWEITGLWTGNDIGDYRSYVASQATPRVGNQRCTCEDLSLRLVTDFAESRGLPVAFANDTYPKKHYDPRQPGTGGGSRSDDGRYDPDPLRTDKIAFRNGLTPEDFDTKADFVDRVLTSTGASDLISHRTAKFVTGAVEGKPESLDLAKEGDLIILGKGGSHVQVVTAVGHHRVWIMQGNFRPKGERATVWDRKVGGHNQNDPNDSKYIGATVAANLYLQNPFDNRWFYKEKPAEFQENRGRVMIWDFDAWNALIVRRVVAAGESLGSIARSQWSDDDAWPRVYGTNKTRLGKDSLNIPVGMTLYVWK